MTTTGKDITVREVIDAIRKNGLPQTRGAFFQLDAGNKHIEGACAVGQALINLGFNSKRDAHPLKKAGEYVSTYLGTNVRSLAISLNDRMNLPLNEIADKLENEYQHRLNEIAYQYISYSV